ncbi:hypothetical protein F8M41_003491 [Gigaspora margarita]|uniref:Uncharacterized protein n=1 Tax=Gigaspora margarita TaxID=4874 RepID=A0A8H4A8G3_GIGMA|nr:hypothetical protein F8M41_003491 [Gigaspora margarita]
MKFLAKSNESTHIPFEQINSNNTMLANNIAWPYRQNQNLNNNYTSTTHISYPRLSSNINPVLYNLDNTRSLNENTDVLYALPLFYNPNIEYRFVATKNFNTSEDQCQSLSQAITILIDETSDSQSLISYNLINDSNQESSSF